MRNLCGVVNMIPTEKQNLYIFVTFKSFIILSSWLASCVSQHLKLKLNASLVVPFALPKATATAIIHIFLPLARRLTGLTPNVCCVMSSMSR